MRKPRLSFTHLGLIAFLVLLGGLEPARAAGDPSAPDSTRGEAESGAEAKGPALPAGSGGAATGELDLRPDEGASAEEKASLPPDPRLRPPPVTWEDPTPLAQVGSDVITAGDFYYALDHGRGIDRSRPSAELKAATIEKLVNERLLVQEAYRRGYHRAGSLVNHVAQLEEQAAGEELRRRIYAGKLDVTESELRELYERYYYTLRVRHLSVEQRDLAAELRTRIVAGEDFGDLARRYSEDKKTAKDGGDMGEVRAGRMIIHFEDAVFALEPGQLSDVIKGQGEHYKIFKLESKVRDRRPPRSFAEMAPDLGRRIRTRKAGDALYAWQKSVIAKYEVTINEPNFAVFSHRLRDKIASWEAINSIQHDSLASQWIFLDWPPEELALELASFKGGRLTVAEFTKLSRQMQACPTCLWRDSDVQLRQYVLGYAFDKLFVLEKRVIRLEQVPALELLVERRKENRLAAMVGATLSATADSVTAGDARTFWEEHKFDTMTGEQARVRRIVVETEAEARDLMDRLAGGADFAALAERYSKDETTNWRGGETDFFLAGSMYGMADVALAHEPGELIPPFQSRLGWEVVQVIEKKPSVPQPFAAVEVVVKTRMATERTERRVEALIAELEKSTPVTIHEEALAELVLPS
jgi:parvulin-like peptidyl-prolyl isomerase